jgi:deoxyhypusine synthase
MKLENLFKETSSLEGIEREGEYLGFQATNLTIAVGYLKQALNNNYRIDLGFTSNFSTSGCRNILSKLNKRNIFDSIVSTAGGIQEDIIQSIDSDFLNIKDGLDDKKLFELGVFRSGNRGARSEGYVKLEQHLEKNLDQVTGVISTSELINKIKIKEKGYLGTFNEFVLCPAIEDGAIGDYLFIRTLRGLLPLNVSFTIDHNSFQKDFLNDDRKKLAILLGGSIPKHYLLNTSIISGGYDLVILLNTGISYDGSNAGAEPSEAYSWGKVAKEGKIVKVFGDFTINFPLLLDKVGLL